MINSKSISKRMDRWVGILVILGVVVTAFYGFRTIRSFAQVQLTGLKPGTTDVNAIRGWMTIPYLAKMYCVSPDYLYKQINVPSTDNDKKSLADLNKEYFSKQSGAILPKIQDAIRSAQPACSQGKISP
ncbi:MAG: hypothetical protein WCK35_08625 [Chloroflexota bacterium]